MEALMLPDPADLAMLLALPAAERLGAILRLNRTPRYANHLDAIALLSRLAEPLPDSSARIPGSAGSAAPPPATGVASWPNQEQQQP